MFFVAFPTYQSTTIGMIQKNMTITNFWNGRPSKFDESQHTSTFASRLPTASFNKVKIGEVYDQSLRDKLRQMKVDVFGLLAREFSVERCVSNAVLEKPLVSFLDAQFHYGIWYKLIRYSKSI